MSLTTIERHFERIGARAKIQRRLPDADDGVTLNIREDREGEYFDIAVQGPNWGQLTIVDARPRLRHLLLMSRAPGEKNKFLCGHDERHWFVAAVPGAASRVDDAFDALKPAAVKAVELRLGVKRRHRNKRRNEAFVRQGEWFFVPAPNEFVNERFVLRNEPLSRGAGSKPHMCEEVVRDGGELVYVSRRFPNGVSPARYNAFIAGGGKYAKDNWVSMRRNPRVYVRGRVRHADHKTIRLDGWHRVLMNRENEAPAMRHVAFLD